MDKKYYYRMLGITRSNPTQQQIREAYDQRMAKLNSSDYEDDRQYARKKMKEATMAYSVLTGAAPSVTKSRSGIILRNSKMPWKAGRATSQLTVLNLTRAWPNTRDLGREKKEPRNEAMREQDRKKPHIVHPGEICRGIFRI